MTENCKTTDSKTTAHQPITGEVFTSKEFTSMGDSKKMDARNAYAKAEKTDGRSKMTNVKSVQKNYSNVQKTDSKAVQRPAAEAERKTYKAKKSGVDVKKTSTKPKKTDSQSKKIVADKDSSAETTRTEVEAEETAIVAEETIVEAGETTTSLAVTLVRVNFATTAEILTGAENLANAEVTRMAKITDGATHATRSEFLIGAENAANAKIANLAKITGKTNTVNVDEIAAITQITAKYEIDPWPELEKATAEAKNTDPDFKDLTAKVNKTADKAKMSAHKTEKITSKTEIADRDEIISLTQAAFRVDSLAGAEIAGRSQSNIEHEVTTEAKIAAWAKTATEKTTLTRVEATKNTQSSTEEEKPFRDCSVFW